MKMRIGYNQDTYCSVNSLAHTSGCEHENSERFLEEIHDFGFAQLG